MENVAKLAAALAKAQGEIKPAVKDSANPAFRGTKYADLTAVWDACREALKANGIAIVQAPNFDGHEVWLETTLLHSSGEHITGRYPLRPTKNDPQGYGSALTYARRYSLAAMIGVVADDDDDGNAASKRSDDDAPARPATPLPQQQPSGDSDTAKKWGEDAIGYVNRTGDSEKFKAWHDKNTNTIARLGELHPDIHKRLIVAINNRLDAFASARAA